MLTELRRLSLLTATAVVAAGLLLWSPWAGAPAPTTSATPNFPGLKAQAGSLAARLQQDLVPLRARAQIIDQATAHGLPAEIGQAVWDEARRDGLDPWLVARVIDLESDWRPTLVHVNADGSRDYGMMQVNERTWPWLARQVGAEDPLDPTDNLRAGAWYLAMGFDRIPSGADEINDRFKELAKQLHPDAGGSADAFRDLQAAREQALQYLGDLKGR